MKEQLQKRLTELKAEFESGKKVLAELDTKQANLRETLIRISGAIQVLEEELGKDNHPVEKGNGESENEQGEMVANLSNRSEMGS